MEQGAEELIRYKKAKPVGDARYENQNWKASCCHGANRAVIWRLQIPPV
jgi:hypothetical protein